MGNRDGDLCNKAGNAVAHHRFRRTKGQLHIPAGNTEDFWIAQVKRADGKGEYLAEDGRECRALHAPAANKNKNRVEDGVGDRAGDHRKHGDLGASLGTDTGIEACADHHEGEPEDDNPAIIERIGQGIFRCAKEVRERLEEKDAEQEECRAKNNQQRQCIAHAPLRLVLPALAQLQAQVGRRAVADQQGKGEHNDR